MWMRIAVPEVIIISLFVYKPKYDIDQTSTWVRRCTDAFHLRVCVLNCLKLSSAFGKIKTWSTGHQTKHNKNLNWKSQNALYPQVKFYEASRLFGHMIKTAQTVTLFFSVKMAE